MSGPILHLLDVGKEQFGDCLLVQLSDGRTILVDGGNPSSFNGTGLQSSIPEQLESLLGPPPFHVSLLIVTHAHKDHIGCLPKLVTLGKLTADWVLAADPDLGWGNDLGGDALSADAAPTVQAVFALLREDADFSRLTDSELEDAAADALDLQGKYRQMLDDLEGHGSQVIRYIGRAEAAPVIEEFAGVGLQILGPSELQLLRCAQAIEDVGRDWIQSLGNSFRSDAPQSLGTWYRQLVVATDAADGSVGAAVNNQSLVLLIEDQGVKLLLTADMQLAGPQVSGIDAEMQALRQRIHDRAPFEFVKIAHHGSHNAFDAEVLQELGDTVNFAISTGRDSKKHPHPGVLQLLQSHTNDLLWLRTDHNGHCTFDFSNENPTYAHERGSANDSQPNAVDVVPRRNPPAPVARPPVALSPVAAAPPVARVAAVSPAAPAITTEPIPGFVEITAKVPHVTTRVTLTIDVAPNYFPAATPAQANVTNPVTPADPNVWRLAGGRSLPPLCFATVRSVLEQRIGAGPVQTILEALRQAGMLVVDDIPAGATADAAASHVRARVVATPGIRGVVLLGGLDVVPANILDVLPPALRQELGHTNDPDDFVVFSDDLYGCTDGDSVAELPVSRIPDAGSSELMFAALGAVGQSSAAGPIGVRNIRRPFADGVFELMDQQGQMHTSREMVHSQLPQLTSNRMYFMLHGDWEDGGQFWGEEVPGQVAAVHVNNIVPAAGAVIFTGCCWGALTTDHPAAMSAAGWKSKPVEQSIALKFLHHGADAFIGCTGAHYSPTVAPYGYFGEPLHRSFWTGIQQGRAPADALFQAKADYIAGMFHGRTGEFDKAVEYKILRQYTCLGLGW